MKKAFKWLATLCAVLAVAAAFTFGAGRAAAAGSKLDLSKMQIVLPAEATAVEQSAAAELNVYLEKMTGSTLPIVPEGQSISGKAVYIGATQFAAGNAVAYPTDGDEFGEGWAIRAVDGNLVLTGAPTRGVLYAVYHLLEDGLGVRWWTPWDEDIPTGGSAEAAITEMKKRGCKNIKLMVLLAAPEGVERIQKAHPDVDIYCGAVDDHLNEHGYIVPGLGDAGDRIFGTK